MKWMDECGCKGWAECAKRIGIIVLYERLGMIVEGFG